MRKNYIISSLFFVILASASIADLMHDRSDDLSNYHMIFEIITLIISLGGATFFLLKTLKLFNSNKQLQLQLKKETDRNKDFQEKIKKISEGLSFVIDEEFERWQLSHSEKQIGLLILKGLATKDISNLQGISDKTVRQHCTSIYKKSGLNGRSELSAYFLEDLLLPQ